MFLKQADRKANSVDPKQTDLTINCLLRYFSPKTFYLYGKQNYKCMEAYMF